MGKRESFIDWVKVLAIGFVILFHFSYQTTGYNSLRVVGFIGVSLFFIISGFVLAKNYKNLEKISLKWFGKRYFKIAIIYYPALILIPLLFYSQTHSGNLLANILSHFLFIDSQFTNYAYGIISPAWFLVPLMIFYLFFPIINKIIKKHMWIIFPIFLSMIYLRFIKDAYTSINPLFFLGEFCFGIAFAYNKKLHIPIMATLMVLFVNPLMILPFLIFTVFFIFKNQIGSYAPISIISSYTLVLFLFHEGLMNLIFSKWHIYSLSNYYAIPLYIILVISLTVFSNKIYKKLYY